MKLALIGATGFVGAALLTEALACGHEVTALARSSSKLAARPGLAVVQADSPDPGAAAKAVAGHDAVLSAYNPGWTEPNLYELFLQGSAAIVEGLKRARVERLLVAGGAGSLFVAPGVQLVDTPAFPAEWKAGASAARDALNQLLDESSLAWAFLSPAAHLDPGARRGGFRIGGNELLMNDRSPAHRSVGDLGGGLA
jgi:putative NADH-flavin reductase